MIMISLVKDRVPLLALMYFLESLQMDTHIIVL